MKPNPPAFHRTTAGVFIFAGSIAVSSLSHNVANLRFGLQRETKAEPPGLWTTPDGWRLQPPPSRAVPRGHITANRSPRGRLRFRVELIGTPAQELQELINQLHVKPWG